MPTGEAPHKSIEPEPGREVRLEMARLAAAGEPGVSVSDLEVEREGPSYAYRTLELLVDENPGSQLTFVMGADVAAGLESWHRPERVLELARVAIAERPGFDRSEADEVLERLGVRGRTDSIDMPAIGVSSSMIRARVAAGRPLRWLVPEAVAELIAGARPLRGGGGMTPEELARRIAAVADSKQAEDIVALDVGEMLGYTDVLVICTARNERLAKAIHDEVQVRLKKEDGLLPRRVEGLPEARWVLLDYLDCILHIFVPETRDLYRLDQLWGEAPAIDLELGGSAGSAPARAVGDA